MRTMPPAAPLKTFIGSLLPLRLAKCQGRPYSSVKYCPGPNMVFQLRAEPERDIALS